MKNKLILLFLAAFLTACGTTDINQINTESQGITEVSSDSSNQNSSPQQNLVSIKYRTDQVDLNNQGFEHLNTSKSSFIRGAWYDKRNSYLVINLNGIYYH